MKKATYIILVIVIAALFVSNTSENEFVSSIDNSKDPFSQHYMLRLYKNANPIFDSQKRFFSPTFDLEFLNLGLFSVATVESGWSGTLRIDGAPLGEFISNVSRERYLLVFGKEIKL